MNEHWSANYIGKPYVENEYDCAHMLEDVQTNVFHRNVDIPVERAKNVILTMKKIDEHRETYLTPISEEEAVDGDVVLMVCRGRLSHIGVLCVVDGIRYVLHNLKTSGNVALHKIRDLDRIALRLDGFYRCRESLNTTPASN